jgi:hypothetical protein
MHCTLRISRSRRESTLAFISSLIAMLQRGSRGDLFKTDQLGDIAKTKGQLQFPYQHT